LAEKISAAPAACSARGSDLSHSISGATQTLRHSGSPTSATTSLSTAREVNLVRSATTAAHSPAVWVMLPTKKSGQTGIPSPPTLSGKSTTPNSASARRAHCRPAANSALRDGTASATNAASSFISRTASPGSRSSATTAPAGNNAARSAVSVGAAGILSS